MKVPIPGYAARVNGESGNGRTGRAARWLLGKVWAVCVVAAAFAASDRFGWPPVARTAAGILGALAVAAAVAWLPRWSTERPTGVPGLDTVLRAVVWSALVLGVVVLLAVTPALGAAAGALLLTAVWRTLPRSRRQAPDAVVR
ncbi:hypothetical protein Acy02nite_71790 [Actinoplanes cyaneus]|uniref:Uncharacterized protein n=1 Tax=Actinoplanes cyaneus TaxID=52696 RepID=A0A919ITG4_9ACTN|nr:hypothetical protein [Actinoplanes cyaneus]MCW2142279.1 hypothetical protein [Actinoplanes cyaneus]GID69298.1 hypothetical protein Acy02nite_71790 [Actinoplanes cyaneus]